MAESSVKSARFVVALKKVKARKWAMMLKLNDRVVHGVGVLECSGRIVFGEESSTLRDAVNRLLIANPNLILNLSGIKYIDSGGLGTLVSLYTSAKETGGSIKLASLTQRVGNLMEVTKLHTVFEVYENESQALKAFEHGTAA
jgi:anti-sigma B factor antagonist